MAGILVNKKNHYCDGYICSGQKQQEPCTFGNRKKIQKFKMTKNFGKSRKGRSLTQTRKVWRHNTNCIKGIRNK